MAQAQARHILVEDEALCNALKTKIVGGEDFVNNIKGASRWATNTFDWLKGIGRR